MPSASTRSECSGRVSATDRVLMQSKFLSLMATSHHHRVSSFFFSAMCFMTFCHVRIASLGSVPFKYTRARDRLKCGWLSDSLRA